MAHTNSSLINSVTGLPGPGALLLGGCHDESVNGWPGPWCIGWAPAGMAEVVSFHHRLLLDDDDEIGDVIRAFHEVWDHLRAPR